MWGGGKELGCYHQCVPTGCNLYQGTKNEKLLAQLCPLGGGGGVITNDWCLTSILLNLEVMGLKPGSHVMHDPCLYQLFFFESHFRA